MPSIPSQTKPPNGFSVDTGSFYSCAFALYIWPWCQFRKEHKSFHEGQCEGKRARSELKLTSCWAASAFIQEMCLWLSLNLLVLRQWWKDTGAEAACSQHQFSHQAVLKQVHRLWWWLSPGSKTALACYTLPDSSWLCLWPVVVHPAYHECRCDASNVGNFEVN